jgi:uncharacterized repeat protein (TIGR01451 family)
MRIALQNRGTAFAAALLVATGVLAFSSSAQADPGSVSTGVLTVTVDDTTPAPGQVITVGVQYHRAAGDSGANSANQGFGSYSPPPQVAVNLADLAFVSGSCTGDFSSCTYNPAITNAFDASVPVGNTGDTISGTAQFTVSPSATDGETIAFAGHHEALLPSGNRNRNGTPLLNLTVTGPPPAADLGVALSASAAGLLISHVNYDATVTNNGPAAATSATITTQLPSQATSITSSTCTYSSSTDQVSCPIGALANGASAHATFSAYFGLLTIGLPLNATATRTASAPTDTNAANDSDGASCVALTTLLIGC